METGTNYEEIFRRSVTKLEYVDAETLVSGSEDGTMRVWSVATGAHKEELDGGSFAFSKDSSSEQKVDTYSIAFRRTCCSSQKTSRWLPSSVPHT